MEHSTDMNYSKGQSISFYIDNKILIEIWFSSLSDFYTIRWFSIDCKIRRLSEQKQEHLPLIDKIKGFIEENNFEEFPNHILYQTTNFLTEMDCKPANYFEVFFSEID